MDDIEDPTLLTKLLEQISEGAKAFRQSRDLLKEIQTRSKISKKLEDVTREKNLLKIEANRFEREIEKLERQVEALEDAIRCHPAEMADVIQEILDFTPPALVVNRMNSLCEVLRNQARKPADHAQNLDYLILAQLSFQYSKAS